MGKILSIGNPPIICALHHAYPLSILASYDDYLPWFYSHYIQVEYPRELNPENEVKRFNFFRWPFYSLSISPWLQIQNLHRNIVDKANNNIIRFISECIDDDYYIRIDVDEFYISEKSNFHESHYTRELLIYGYDEPQEEFSSIGFDHHGVFASFKISFSDLEKAYHSADLKYGNDKCRVFLFRYITEATYNFDLVLVFEQIRDYLFSVDTSERYRIFQDPTFRSYRTSEGPINHAYGMETYKHLKYYLESLTAQDLQINRISFQALWEHKKCMHSRLKYMEDCEFLDQNEGFSINYSEIEQKSNMLRLMAFKYDVTENEALKKRMIDLLGQIAEQESVILDCLVGKLQKQVADLYSPLHRSEV